MSYQALSDEDKIIEAIRFVARGETIPTVLKQFLDKEGLYELIVNPQELRNVSDQRTHIGH